LKNQYDAASIEVLTGLDPVRKRPGMYTDTTRPNHLAQEVVDNSVDEAIAGYATQIGVILHADQSLSVIDNGRGMPVDMQPLYELATASNILVLEDAAQAIGTSYKGEQIGSSGNPVAFSFHPNKNMTTIEGGAIACRDDGLIKLLESIRFHGIDRNESGEMMVEEWGGKMNMPDVCASVGLAQLQKLAAFNQKRRTLAQRYFDHLPRHPAMVLPADADGHSWHMFCICLDFEAIAKSREEVISEFRQQNIMLGIHYPAIHLFGLYQRFGYGPGDFPVAERIGQQTLTLPLFPAMTNDDVDRVCGQFRNMLD